MFADHSIERVYWALVNGHPSPREGTIRGKIGRSDANRKKMAVLADTANRGKHATTHYKTLKTLDGAARVECRLETGRTHQIRVHMQHLGFSLVGESMYGKQHLASAFHRQALHARRLGLVHPGTGEPCEWVVPLPADLAELIGRAGIAEPEAL